MFLNVLNVIGFMEYCENQNIGSYEVNFDDCGVYYEEKMGPNWWSYYFEPIERHTWNTTLLSFLKTTNRRINSDQIDQFVNSAEYKMDREKAFELISKYIKVKQNIKDEVQSFIDDNFKEDYIIGVHYRGTDKTTLMQGCAPPEASFVKYEKLFEAIESQIAIAPASYKIFIATDEAQLIGILKDRYQEKLVFIDAMRSEDGKPLHYGRKTSIDNYNYRQGKEALIDCLLLARCDCLVKTSSNLNLCASYFNSKMPVYSLSDRLHDV
ncbi:MAG: nodulation protein NodZ [Rhabdochlamydiaceae bacterium]|nr:nodulation protein NodZ [Candidatus Amphrikana amoebophyrae]